MSYLRDEKLWGNDDPLFPSTRIAGGASRPFEAAGLSRVHWSTATPIRNLGKPQKIKPTDAKEIAEAIFQRFSKDSMDSL